MPTHYKRRTVIGLMAGAGLGAAAPLMLRSQTANPGTDIDIRSARFSLIEGITTEGLVSTRPDAPPPVIRMRRNMPYLVRVTNRTDDYTAMHWHGLRLDNAMDGVPYLTQLPIAQNETFEYELFSPDAGTFWYHPHCMTMDQMALGLTGILIVEEDEDPGFDADVPLNLRDFRLDGNGDWIDLWTARGAARGGTFGTIKTTNWLTEPKYEAPSGGIVRLRVAATDTTRIYKLFLPDAKAKIIALDGHPLPALIDMPKTKEEALLLGPGQRADIAVRMPQAEGQIATLFTDAPGDAHVLARIVAKGASENTSLDDVVPLPSNPVPEPDLADAHHDVIDVVFDVDLAVVVGVETHGVEVGGVPLAERALWHLAEALGVGDAWLEVSLVDDRLDGGAFDCESEEFAGGVVVSEAVFHVEDGLGVLGVEHEADRPAGEREVGGVGVVLAVPCEELVEDAHWELRGWFGAG